MRALAMDFRTQNGDFDPRFPVDKTIRDALADHCRRLYPANSVKLLAREYGLSLDEAKGVLAGRARHVAVVEIARGDLRQGGGAHRQRGQRSEGVANTHEHLRRRFCRKTVREKLNGA